MSAPFVLILSYVIGGLPKGQNAELFHFQVDQISLDACEHTKAKIQGDFPGMTGGCHINIPKLSNPAAPCLFPGYSIITDNDGCPRYWIKPAAAHAP